MLLIFQLRSMSCVNVSFLYVFSFSFRKKPPHQQLCQNTVRSCRCLRRITRRVVCCDTGEILRNEVDSFYFITFNVANILVIFICADIVSNSLPLKASAQIMVDCLSQKYAFIRHLIYQLELFFEA